ncbi:NAD(P)H-quinone oxidoreductase [Leeuwenhoekiella polynyae]|uniref:Putative PIG3 family NAD(P)H quinone oxidoreductase n=1 Tax=Leeuwenhoekiella polynyae TaxID=1550906 RepID=A0A4Q0NVQ7_9FLAO|nr:NAD(P)H-quinone oxidoreductase [Leeuwenhoekiella polynyae]RXG15785.1 putative PIG3 family NAD(P)H quinone oxidoreductase [Leeuwenhoekiella polynyae]
MKAIVITEAGGPEVLKLKTVGSQPLAAHHVRIAVKAAGVNRSDILTRKNPDAYGDDTPAAQIPGLEVAGEIIERDEDVESFKVGDAVCALVAGGGYATEIVVDARLCLPVPKDFSFVEAAALPEVMFTVWFNVFQQAKAKKGEKLLIHGGTSGIGIMGLQMAKALGLKTYTTVGSQEKIDFVEKYDLAEVINYKETDFELIFADKKIDVILDMVGGGYTQKNLNILNKKGRLVHINGMNGLTPEINLWTIMSKQLTLTGSLLKPEPIAIKQGIASEIYKEIWPLLNSKMIKPFIYKTFTLDDASKAHQLMESSKHIGKIILEVA